VNTLIALYEITGEKRLLDGAIRAGEWALTRPLVANFNYNGFSAALFADLYRVTQHEKWMHAAIHYAKLGVLSGQNVMGHNTGDWPDPHNQRLVYRILMIAQLADVLKALPLDNVDRSWIKDGMDHALESVEKQQRNHGGLGNVNSALIMYCKLASISDHYLSSDISLLLQNFLAQSIREQRMPSALYGTICMFNL
jgi:hypothetical protein